MPRLTALVAVLLVALSGCAPSRTLVQRSDAAGIAAAHTRLLGREAEIRMVSGEQHVGRVREVRLDSTAWNEAGARHTVPTTEVASFRFSSRPEGARRGALIGLGVGGAVALVALATTGARREDDSLDVMVTRAFALLSLIAGPAHGAGIGAVVGRPVEIHLVE